MRRWCVVLLLVALLPLRSWAVAGWAVPTSDVRSVAGSTLAEVMPCHAGIGDASGALSDDAPTVSLHPCLSCDLCQASPALPAGALRGPAPALLPGPQAAHDRDTGRVLVTGPERPPRA